MTSPSQQTLAGHFLIAMPSLADPPFSRGVAFVCQHDEDGAVGLLINQLSEYRLGDVLAQMKLGCSDIELADAPVLIGGPVQQESGFVLHREHGHWESSYRGGMWDENFADIALPNAIAMSMDAEHRFLKVPREFYKIMEQQVELYVQQSEQAKERKSA